ncbi:KICSTOR complex protein SZT2 isoform X5 [Melopsittacus undulatus]|uniref:KICSTOR complex protein SZT2 isoform X5 n=1 Tax=Melopsittacus undulatus TaxID=13146 RepID=UPI00146D0847|nr:KICSTOR complex protein SZT2 isoform X5 [Melopsittacus undulatus]
MAAAERPDSEVEEAGHVFLLMKKDYRISRNVRLAWVLSRLHQVIWAVPEPELVKSENELDVLSILPNGWQPDEPVQPRPYLLVPSTRVTFLARQYRFVIELDLSPSTGIVDDSTGEIIFDEVFHALSRCLVGLLRPFRIPGSDIIYQPEIFVTIQAYSSIIGLQSHQVLFQGCQLDETKREAFLHQVYTQLCAFENKVAEMLQQQYEPKPQMDLSPLSQESPGDVQESSGRKPSVSVVTADVGLVSMVRQGILALQLLPSNSSAGIIIITDGVTSVPDVAVCETLLNQLRSGTVACSFVQVGGVYSYDCSFGHVPNVELMKFIAMATFGAYLSTCPELDPLSLDLNVYHKAFLLYSFLRTGESLNPEYYCVSQHRLFNEHLVSASSNPALAMRRKKHTEKEVHADLVSIVSVRLREGYSIREVNITKGGSQLEVKLVLLWKHNMRIEYLAVTPWPLDPSKRSTWVEVTMEGSYDILHDISCTMRKPITSLYRTTVIRRFWNTLQSINQTDQMLVHLQSFDTVPEHFTIPESTKNGVPLFYIPPGSTTPVLSLQHSGSDSSHSQFASYWKPILSMDANFWQRWLHMHRIVLLLEHDTPVPKHLHTPGNNGRYSTIQCRISHSALTSLLRDWSSFVLVEGYSYVKLIHGSEDPTPSSFYVVRIISKAPCMVLRLGFPIGTPAQARNKIVEELRDRILQLRFPHRVQSKEATPKAKRKTFGSSSPSKSPPVAGAQSALSDRPCLVVLHKPLEKLLIRYEKLPSDYRAPFILNLEHPPVSGPLTMVANRTASSTLASLSRYFYHQRWIWSVQSGLAPAVPITAVAQLLSTLTEVRLSEGFHFASSGDGIINMVLELPIQIDGTSESSSSREKHTCVVQYILFPPHSTSTKDSFSTDDDNDTEVEAIEVDTELNLVTECWVEPQSGYVHSTAENWKHLNGLPYQKIPKALYPRDLACIATMLTFEYISQLCQNKEWVCPPSETKTTEDPDMGAGFGVHEIPFQFNLMKLLPRCQQVEMFFLMLTKENEEVTKDSSFVPNEMLLNLFHGCLQHDLSDREIPMADADHVAFMEQVLQRDRDGHQPPFTLPVIREESLKASAILEQQDASASYHLVGSNGTRDMTGSTSTLQSLGNTDLPEDDVTLSDATGPFPPQWRCYAKLVNTQHVFLTFLPATFSDVQKLMACGLDKPPKDESQSGEDTLGPVCAEQVKDEAEEGDAAVPLPTLSITPAHEGSCDPGEQGGSSRRDVHISFCHQNSQSELGECRRFRCPIYIYSCSLELLREQLVSPRAHRPPRDIFFRSQSLERPPATAWLDHKHKELVSYCTLLQEHSHQCYVKGLFKSLQQSHSISSQDLLTAMDYCEELLQEIDITNFLLTVCSHVRSFRESHQHFHTHTRTASFQVGSIEHEEEQSSRERGVLVSESSAEMEDYSEQDSHNIASPTEEPKSSVGTSCCSEFPLSLLEIGQPCQAHPDLHKIIQEKFLEIGSLHFKPVPSNPHYFFYCPPSAKKEEEAPRDQADRKGSEDMEGSELELAAEEGAVSGCCIATESDPELEVEYREKLEHEFPDTDSLSDSNTVNQDDDSFSVLGGDSLNEQEFLEQEMPPLFVHLTCSVKLRSQHSSMPVQSLPTCLGEVLGCLESCQGLSTIDLGDLCVTLDIFVLTLPLEIEVVNADILHNRCTSESSVSFTRSPGQPSSFRSDEDIMHNLERLPSTGDERHPALSNLPGVHRQAIEATMNEIRWLLDDEIVSALRHSQVISTSILHRVATHIYNSKGRPSCHSEVVLLQFVFGPEHSLEKFKEEFRRMVVPGYMLNAEGSDYHYISISRLHSRQAAPNPSGTPSLQQPAGGGTRTTLGQAGQEGSSEAEAEGSELHHTTCALAEEARSLWGWPESETHIVPDTGNPPIDSHMRDEVPGEALSLEQSRAPGHDSLEEAAPEAAVQSLPSSSSEKGNSEKSPLVTPTAASLADSVTQGREGSSKQRPSRVQSLVSSQGSMDSDHLGYDGGSSDSEYEEALMSDQEPRCPLMPDFWLIIKIQQDRVEVYYHTRSLSVETAASAETEEEQPGECQSLNQVVVKKISEICRVVNQRLLLQDLHDSHICNSLLVAESEEDIWKSETPYTSYRQRVMPTDDYSVEESYQPRDYLAATMQFMPGHFACDVVWSTLIHVHSRLKMGPNMGVSRAIQALRSVLNAFSVVNRKNMFVYQERATKSVFYLRLTETTYSGKVWEAESVLSPASRSLALTRSQEPIYTEDLMGSRSSLDSASCRSVDSARPVGQIDRHIQLMVHGVAPAGPEITDELVKVLRRRLDEATLDIITVMLVRNCKLTPADVEFIQPPGMPPTEVLHFALPPSALPWLHAVAYYLRQNLLIFLHTPKYTDSNVEHHFKHYFNHSGSIPDQDLYLYNKPGGQGTGGKGIACIALTFVDEHGSPTLLPHGERPDPLKLPSFSPIVGLLQDTDFESLTAVSKHQPETGTLPSEPRVLVRLDIWEKGNISLLQLSEKLRGALRHALCDAVMEFLVLPAPLCVEAACPLGAADLEDLSSAGGLRRTMSETKGLALATSGASRSCPPPLHFTSAPSSSSGEPVTPTSKLGRRSFWDMLSKAESSELGSPKTTDDIVLERPEEARTRRRHKTESVKQHQSQDRATATAELEQAQRRRACQLEEGDVGTMHPIFNQTCQQWMAFMNHLGCPSVQQCSVEIVSRFLLSSILVEVVSLVTTLASDTTVKVFEQICCHGGSAFLPYKPGQSASPRPAAVRHFILLGRNFQQWRCSTEQAHKGLQRFEAMEFSSAERGSDPSLVGRDLVPRQRFLFMEIIDKKLTLYTYNWSPDLGANLNCSLTRLLQWQNARSHIVHCLISQKLGLFHHHCFMDTPWHEDSKQEPNPFLNSTLEVDALIRSSSPPPSKEQGRLSSSARSLPSLHFHPDVVPFDEALRDVTTIKRIPHGPESGPFDPVSWHGAQFLEIKSMERKELEKQMKIENLFVTWQQRSAQSNMPISLADLETLKQSSRLVHYCATPLLFDPAFRQQIQTDQQGKVEGKKRHRSNDSTASGRDRSHSCDSAEALPCKVKEEPWLQEMCNAFLQQYIQYLQSMGFILVQVRPPSPTTRSTSRIRALAAMGVEGRGSFSYTKPKTEGSPKSTNPAVATYHLQRALPGGIVLMELAFQGYYFCVKQYALECSRIPMGQSVNSQGTLTARARSKSCMGPSSVSESALSMLFTEECDKVRDLMHVHSFSYDFHLRIVHQYLLGSHMTLRQGYHLTSFLEDFIAHHTDIPKFGRNHVFQGTLALPTNMITAHQLYNYIADHANTYHMKPLRMARPAAGSDNKKGTPGTEQNEYALVSIWNSSGSYKDSEGLRHHDDFDVSLLVCHSAAPFEEQSEAERRMLRLRFYVIMTSQRELFPRLTADMRRFKKLPRLQREVLEPVVGRASWEAAEPETSLGRQQPAERELWQDVEDSSEFYAGGTQVKLGPGLFYTSPLFPLLASEVASAQKQLSSMVQLAKCHCRRDNLWKRLFLLEPLASDKLKLGKLSLVELEELLEAVHGKSIADVDPQLECFLTMTVSWYQSLIKVLLSRFPQSCRHFHNTETGTQYLVVLNQKFTDCFVLVFLDSHSGKTQSLTVVFREPFPVQPQNSESPLPQLVSTYHHLESVINTACFNLWTGLL